MKPKAIVIGAGIVGLATARALARKGFQVEVFDKSSYAAGASIRNFGMVWPIGQPTGELYERAMRSRSIWLEIANEGFFWHDPVGSMHLAYHSDEWDVLQEIAELYHSDRNVELVQKAQLEDFSMAINPDGCFGGIYSPNEVIVNPVQAIRNIPRYLEQKWGVKFHWDKCVSYICDNTVYVGCNEEHDSDIVFICSGSDFETLYPEKFEAEGLTKCKLQMMRIESQKNNWRIGPALCGGLSLIHYKGFADAPSLHHLKERYESEMAEYIKHGIHVMVSQNNVGELTIGDSHEYGLTFDPFDSTYINDLILEYLKTFTRFNDHKIIESWNGIYAKSKIGKTEIFTTVEPGVYIINALSGAGMTLSFGLAEEVIDRI